MKYKLEELIDIPLIQELQNKLNVIYSFPSAIIDNDGKVLTAVAWQDICTKFHRVHPVSEKECIKSDQYILEHLHNATPAVSYRCPHGMIDNAAPIIIDGQHLGNFFTGQFFLEKPDLEFFKRQSKLFGFDEKEYLAAVEKVPVWTKEKLNHYLDFIKGFIEIIAGIGLKNLNEINANKKIKESEERFRTTLYSIGDAVIATDANGLIKQINPIAEQLTGWNESEAKNRPLEEVFKIINEETRLPAENPVDGVLKEGKIIELANHSLLISKQGIEIPIADSGAPIKNENGDIDGVVLVFRDQTRERNAQIKIINSLKEKEILLQEIHHRVKNNFQRIISLIGLQAEQIKNKDVIMIFEELQTRLRSMALIHELMYASGQFTGVDVKEYIEKLTMNLLTTYSTTTLVQINLDMESHHLDLDTIIPCGLIINELITNSLKHAFPSGSKGSIRIKFCKINDEYSLTFSDNGIGIKSKVDFENIHTLGLKLVDLLVKQLHGSLELEPREKGVGFIIRFRGKG